MFQIQLTREAFGAMTQEQKNAILHLAGGEVDYIEVTKQNPFGLPKDYLAFQLRYTSGNSMYGGIAPNGDVST